MRKKLLAYINAEGETGQSVAEQAMLLENHGIDGIILFNFSESGIEREEFFDTARAMIRAIDIPVTIGCRVSRFEDTKKAFYTGAGCVALRYSDIRGTSLLKESVERFGEEHIMIKADADGSDGFADDLAAGLVGPFGGTVLEASGNDDRLKALLELLPGNAAVICADGADIDGLLSCEKTEAAAAVFEDAADIMKIKRRLKAGGIDINTFESSISFAELKKNGDGLVPCIVQDYRNNEVLMLAYMDEEAFERTVETGIMTYHSRSRNELWVKGMTSGHFQYVRQLTADCDRDTILAKVEQIGNACHTGSRSCFFNELVSHEFVEKNAYRVLSTLYEVVADRKVNPREGSYTNYLFDKGIDKILKKCGEEATEMVIAAKNPNAEELKYEIADLLYHMTVLMVECNVDWDDVVAELLNR